MASNGRNHKSGIGLQNVDEKTRKRVASEGGKASRSGHRDRNR